jgi:hypothetical protein
MHLDDTTYRRLVDGSLPGPEGQVLAEHLQVDCEVCEAFLAARPAGWLDGRVDAALASLPGSFAGAGHDLEFARIQGALARPRPASRRWAPGLALAAGVLLAGLAGLILPRGPVGDDGWQGLKGRDPQAVPLRLRFLVISPAVGGPPSLERGVSGQAVPAAASLQFEVELGRAANVLLARAGGSGAPEVFLAAHLPAGRNVVSLDGRPAAYPLRSLAGPQRFLALASEAAIDPADAARAAALGAAARRDEGPAISLDLVVVQVRP